MKRYLYIPDNILLDLYHYVTLCPTEIGGIGHITTDGLNFSLTKVVLLQRKVGWASVGPAPDAQAKYVASLRTETEIRSLRFFWHSHPGNMTPSPSWTDESSVHGLTHGIGWIVWVIFSRKMRYYAACEIIKNRKRYRLPLIIKVIKTFKSRSEIRREIKEKIRPI